MSDHEKFQAFKEQVIRENEAVYGGEARGKYGDEAVDASNQKVLGLSEEEWKTAHDLEEEILIRLEQAVKHGTAPESEEAGEIVALHKKWLCMAWTHYHPKAHRGVAAMYVADERFTAYYDRNVPGCAKFLNDAVQCWVK